MTWKFRFWKRVRDYAFGQMKKHVDGWSRCWKCGNYDFEKSWKFWRTTDHPMIDESECGNCGHINRWRMDAIIPIPVEGPHAQPLEKIA